MASESNKFLVIVKIPMSRLASCSGDSMLVFIFLLWVVIIVSIWVEFFDVVVLIASLYSHASFDALIHHRNQSLHDWKSSL